MAKTPTFDGAQNGRQGEMEEDKNPKGTVAGQVQAGKLDQAGPPPPIEALRRMAAEAWRDELWKQRRAKRDAPPAPPGEDRIPLPPGMPQLTTEEDKALFGMPTLRPDEPMSAGVPRRNASRRPIPRELATAIPILQKIAAGPNPPPEVMQLLSLIARQL